MKLKWKLLAFALSAGTVSLGLGACVFRWLGDYVGDALIMRMID